MAVDDAGNDVGQIAVRLDAEALAAFDQRGDDRPMLGASIGAGEEGVFAREGNRPNGSLDHVVVDFDPAVLKKQAQACPARECIRCGGCRYWRLSFRTTVHDPKVSAPDWADRVTKVGRFLRY